MSNNSIPMRNSGHDVDVEDINVITHYPKDLSDEMVVLVRRISYLKTKIQNINESQIEVSALLFPHQFLNSELLTILLPQ